jgi:non-heme chloroperoxidase
MQLKNGVQLYYQDLGTGKPVVFVHGWCINSDSWEYVINDLPARGIRCIVYDQRGCGRSDKPVAGYGFSTLAGDLAELLEQLDLRDVTLVGHSLGCGVVVRYLAQYGEGRVSGAALLSTTTPFPLRTADNPDAIDQSIFDELIASMKKDRTAYVRSIAYSFFAGPRDVLPVSQDLLEWGIALTLQASPFAAMSLLREMSRTDQREELKGIKIPVLLIHGRQDISSPLALTAEKTLAHLTNGRLKIYEEGAHGFYMVEGERIVGDLMEVIHH